jgi:hypothetical protein
LSILKKLGIPALLGAGMLAATLVPSGASSHREAPLIAQDPVADNTDVYAFKSPDAPDTVTLIANWIPFEEPAGGPNFFHFGDDVLYQIHVDNNGDAVPDITYEWRFTSEIRNPNTFLYNTGPITSIDDPNFNYRQFYDVSVVRNGVRSVIGSHLPVPPDNIGPRSTPNYPGLAAQAVKTLPGGIKSFAGQRDDPFFVDLGSVFDLLGLRPLNTAHALPLPTEPGIDGLGGFNVHTIALQVPISDLVSGDPVIGVYSQTKRQQTRILSPAGPGTPNRLQGAFVNVSRLGNPLVNEVIIPLGEKDLFNASEPVNDAQFAPRVLDPEPGRLIPGLYPVTVPPAPRDDLATIFLTGIPGLNKPANVRASEMLRLNTSTPLAGSPSQLGVLAGDVQGFPNGRRLNDDVVDIELRAIAGATPFTPAFVKSPNNVLGDGVNGNDLPFLTSFPYVATPHQGYSHAHHAVGDGLQPAAPTPAATTPTTTPPVTTTPTTAPTTTVTTAPTTPAIPGCVIDKQYASVIRTLPAGCVFST